MQSINLNQLKLEVDDTHKKDEKLTTIFEPHENEDVVNNAYINTEIFKVEAHLSLIEKIILNLNCIALKKQTNDEFLIGKAVKTTSQKLSSEELLDNYGNSDEVLKSYLFIEEVNERHRLG